MNILCEKHKQFQLYIIHQSVSIGVQQWDTTISHRTDFKVFPKRLND